MNNITHGRTTMANVVIVYATDWRSTKKMAEALAAGEAKSPRADLALRI
jgi:flavorubredoxin